MGDELGELRRRTRDFRTSEMVTGSCRDVHAIPKISMALSLDSAGGGCLRPSALSCFLLPAPADLVREEHFSLRALAAHELHRPFLVSCVGLPRIRLGLNPRRAGTSHCLGHGGDVANLAHRSAARTPLVANDDTERGAQATSLTHPRRSRSAQSPRQDRRSDG
jgi:hypothetical protein